MDKCKLAVIFLKRLKIEFKLLLSANDLMEVIYTTSVGTTMDELE